MTDREMLDFVKSDTGKGMELLIDSYGSLVYKIVSSVILPVGNAQDVEECVSDVFIIFYNHLHKIDLQKAGIKGFLAMVAKRNAISHYRRLKRSLLSENLEDSENEIDFSETAPDLETKQALYEAVKALGEPDTTILVRRYVLGETAKEISENVNLSAEAVQKRLERSIKKLREMLGGVFYG